MRKLKLLYFFYAFFALSIVFYSCSKDGFDSGNDFQNPSCIQTLQYRTKVFNFVKFDVPDEQLTATELMLKMPKEEYFEYIICKKRDGTLRTEIHSLPELVTKTSLNPNTIGINESLKWSMIKDNGQVTIFDEKNVPIENYSTSTNSTIDDLSKLKETSLIPANYYNILIEIMKQTMNVRDFSKDIFIITTMQDGKKTETFIDKRYQREILVAHYDANNILESKNTYLYSLKDNKVRLTNEIFETFKKSMDSNKIMTLVELTEYIYNQKS